RRARGTGGVREEGAADRPAPSSAPRCRARALLLAALLGSGCASPPGEIPVAPGAGVAPNADVVLDFYARGQGFYARLTERRMNALETFNDGFLREHFRTKEAFFDYYADLAHQLGNAHFEKSRPNGVAVQEFVFETPTLAWVQVRFEGADDRPLRP